MAKKKLNNKPMNARRLKPATATLRSSIEPMHYLGNTGIVFPDSKVLTDFIKGHAKRYVKKYVNKFTKQFEKEIIHEIEGILDKHRNDVQESLQESFNTMAADYMDSLTCTVMERARQQLLSEKCKCAKSSEESDLNNPEIPAGTEELKEYAYSGKNPESEFPVENHPKIEESEEMKAKEKKHK